MCFNNNNRLKISFNSTLNCRCRWMYFMLTATQKVFGKHCQQDEGSNNQLGIDAFWEGAVAGIGCNNVRTVLMLINRLLRGQGWEWVHKQAQKSSPQKLVDEWRYKREKERRVILLFSADNIFSIILKDLNPSWTCSGLVSSTLCSLKWLQNCMKVTEGTYVS